MYSLKRGLEAVGKRPEKLNFIKVLFSRNMAKAEEDYLNFLSLYYSIKWEKDKIYFPYDSGDSTAFMENQRVSKITFKNLSQEYKQGLYQMACQILDDVKSSDIKRIVKNI